MFTHTWRLLQVHKAYEDNFWATKMALQVLGQLGAAAAVGSNCLGGCWHGPWAPHASDTHSNSSSSLCAVGTNSQACSVQRGYTTHVTLAADMAVPSKPARDGLH
jgi:hypothetical protein